VNNCTLIKKNFLIYKEIQKGSGASSYVYGKIFAHFLVYSFIYVLQEALPHI
jgi:hypothetical protein